MTNNHPTLSVDPYYDGVPAYMTEVYDWAYVDPKWVQALDRNIVVRILLFLNDQRLMRAYLNEITPGMKVWQVAHVYGDLVKRVAQKVGPKGAFHLTDVTPVQIEEAIPLGQPGAAVETLANRRRMCGTFLAYCRRMGWRPMKMFSATVRLGQRLTS